MAFPEFSPNVNKLTLEQAVKVILEYGLGITGGNSGGPSGGGSVSNIQETRTVTKNAATDANYTIPAGSLGYTILLSADFEGTYLGIPITGAAFSSIPDNAHPSNTIQSVAITRSAGSFSVIEIRKP